MTRGVVTVRHNFETAHRLPFLGGKCENLHGHSWWATWEVSGELSPEGIAVEYGYLKSCLRGWVDTHLDHGAMLGVLDPLAAVLEDLDSSVFVFGRDGVNEPEEILAMDLQWPTVENVATLLKRMCTKLLDGEGGVGISGHRLRCDLVRVQETHVNGAVA